MAFIFGQSTDTPDAATLARRRQMADQLRAQSVARTPRNVGEGIASIGQALAARMQDKRLAPQEQAERDRLSQMLSGLSGGGAAPMGGQYAPAGPNQDIANEAMTAIERPDAQTIRAGLIERGLPEHVADGFIMNFKDESNLDPGINEIAPLVPGSRGGFGLAQWTGPRRKALEAFANERGAAVADPNVQLDFLMTELQGPESRAAQSILSSQDSSAAAQAIARDFLRPAPENLQKRLAQYGGGQAAPMGAPQGGMNPQMIQQLSEIASNPYASEGQKAVAAALMQQQMQAADPMRQIEMETARLQLEQLRNPQQPKPIEVGGVLLDPVTREVLFDSRTQQIGPASVQEYEFYAQGARSRGEQPMPYEQFITLEAAAGNPAGVQTPELLGTQGLVAIPDPSVPQGFRVEPAPGSPLAAEREQQAATTERRMGGRETESSIVTTAAQRAREAAQGRMVGGVLGGVAAMNPASTNAELYRQVDVLRSQAQLGNLQAMRESSPTGGALGSVTEGELKILADKSGALDPASPNFLRDIDDYERTLLRTIHGPEAGDRIFEQTRGGQEDDIPTYNPQTGQWE